MSAYVVLGLLLVGSAAEAEVLRMPPVSLKEPFTQASSFLSGGETWADYRWYTDRAGTPEFGTDFELGGRADLYAARRFALSGVVRLLYQARHLKEYTNPFAFSPRHVTTDLHLRGSYLFEPISVHLGWRHDCTHVVDRGSDNDGSHRTPIHDAVFLEVDYRGAPLQWGESPREARAGVRTGAELNVPPLFVDHTAFLDRGRVFGSLDLEPAVHPRYGGPFVSAAGALIFRETGDTNVSGAEAVNLDWNAAAGYRVPGSGGVFAVYYRVERITDAWIDRELAPYLLSSVGVLLQTR